MPIRIKIEETVQHLSARGGLVLWRETLDQLGLEKKLAAALPTYKIVTAASSYEKWEAMVLGLAAGSDNLDDMDRLALDPAFDAVTGELVTGRSYGDYLRRFDAQLLRNMRLALIENALELRLRLGLLKDDYTLLLDSTDHKQHGEKMEGLAWNYKNNWGLDSLVAFDELGFQLWSDVRKGSAATSTGSSEVIHEVMKRLPRRVKRMVLADSGYCNFAFFNACANAQAKFCCVMRKLMLEPLLGRITRWNEAKKVMFYDGRECEIGSCIYRPKGLRETLRVVVIRALRPKEQDKALFDDVRYDYHGWVTNVGEHDGMKNEEVVLWYRQRSNVERFIAEMKNGFDLKHLPCQKLNANRAYALMAAFAQNLVRFAAYVENPKRPNFAKVLRFKMLMLPVQVVRHARSVSFRFMTRHKQEVESWLKKIKQYFGYVEANCIAVPPAP
jgi:hypothetical protein